MNKSFLSILITATVLFSACRDELEQNNRIPIVEGDEINFGASNLASFGNGYSEVSRSRNSRTSYGDASFDGNKWHYPLNWVYGDQIKVYCGEAADAVARDYRIEWAGGSDGNVASDNSTAYMVKVGENGLHWGDINKKHHFYAFYPASSINNDGAFKEGVVHDTIPGTQEMVEWQEKTINGKTVWVGKPNMEYAYMSADTIIDPKTADNKVGFEFKPLTTAVEITLIGKDGITGNGIPLTSVQITSEKGDKTEKQAVCGAFEHNILTGVTTVHNDNVATDYMITVPLWQKSKTGDDLIPLQLKGGDTVRFTVFLLPGTYKDSEGKETRTLKNLQVRVPGWNSGVRVKYYDGINLEVGTKSQIWLPDYNTNDKPNTWLGSLPDNVYISQLSIPGSVNAFSSFVNTRGYTEGSTEMAQTQTLSVQEQFKYGVRAFEMATERNGNSMGDLVAGDDHSSEDFDYAMKLFADLIAENPTEFVLAIPYYSPTSLFTGGNTENIPAWIEAMRSYINGLPKINKGGIQTPAVTASNGEQIPILPFSNTMTIGDARKSILLLTRVATGDQTNPQHTTVIKNWNAARDRWENRGWKTWSGDGNYVPNPDRPDNNWIYPSEAPASVGTPTYHVQDWMRVCKETKSYRYGLTGWNSKTWYASKTEKETDIKEFMNETIGVLKETTNAGDVFINNLSGFYIVDGGRFSADYDGNAGGKMGDVPAFARDMNNLVYEKIMSFDYNSRGPLGIILINYAGSPDAFGLNMRGDYIVKALVDNNFRFPLLGSSGK